MDRHGKGAATRSRSGRIVAAAGLALAFVAGTAAEAYAQRCKPSRPRPPIVLSNMGLCEFDPEAMSFAGKPVEQAMCLMRAAEASRNRNVGPMLESIPPGIARRVGETAGLPDRDALATHLVEQGLAWDYAPFLWTPLARARDNDIESPQARYLVIHDTSSPFIGGQPFPADIDENANINSLARYDCKDDWALAHVFINRAGRMLLSRELSEPWRATKFERAAVFDGALKGLFLHIELVQPRGSLPGRGYRNDARAPDPGFSQAQYDRLALVYVLASVRAGRWLIPAFHAAIDSGIRGGHDDPQNFELATFAASIDNLTAKLGAPPLPELPAVVASITEGPADTAKPVVVSAGSASAVRASIARRAEPEPVAAAEPGAAATTAAVATDSAPASANAAVAALETPATGEASNGAATPAPTPQAQKQNWKHQRWKQQQTWKQQQAWKRQGWKRQSWKRQTWQKKSYRSRYVSSKPKSRYRR